MIVHLIASAEKITDDIDNLRHIVSIIHSLGHSLAVDWVEPAYARMLSKTSLASVNWQSIYKENMVAITKADVIIAESTHRSFGTGYQIAVAVRQRKKPTLILRRDDVQNDIMAVGVTEKGVKFKTYNTKTLEKIISAFLKKNTIPTKELRFNFFLDGKTYNYLSSRSQATGDTKSEVVRKLLEREMEKSDTF